ncbi:ribonuclease H-like domain-containing protein [Tanacetum coccineum]|uniref:Ribonuclease H-like domain-containing protein n=1 Tax=Tanacetum coccineum TaxID=301880 RepID=A0ABQ5HDT5_9ASTR
MIRGGDKPGLDELEFDDLYNNLKVTKQYFEKQSTVEPASISKREYYSGCASSKVQMLLNCVPTKMNIICSFFAQQASMPTTHDDEDLLQIEEDAMEEIDIQWQVAMITARIRKFMRKTGRPIDLKPKNGITFDKSKIECFNCQKLGHFARECRFAKYQENRANGRQEKRIVAIEDSNSKALVATDNNEDIDWVQGIAAEPNIALFGQDGLGDFRLEQLTLMFHPVFSSFDGYKSEARTEILGYQMSLESLEVILKTHEKNEYAWGDKYEQMEYDLKAKDLKLEEKQKELDQLLKEEMISRLKLEKWSNASSVWASDNSSGNTNSTDSLYPNFQKTKGFHSVPPPTGTIIPPRANVSFTGIDELAIRNKVLNQENTKSNQPEIDRNKVIMEDWVDSDDGGMRGLLPSQRKSFIPSAVLTREGLKSTARPKMTQNSTFKKMDNTRPRTSSFSPSTRSSTTRTPHRPQRPKKIVKSIWVKKGSTVGSQAVLPQTVKESAMINQTWRPKGAYLDSVNRDNGSYTLKQFEYGNPEEDLKDYAIIDSGCSGREDIQEKEPSKNSCIDFERVSYVEALIAPRKIDVYKLDLKNIIPSGGGHSKLCSFSSLACRKFGTVSSRRIKNGKGPDWMFDLELLTPSLNYITCIVHWFPSINPVRISNILLTKDVPLSFDVLALMRASWFDASRISLLICRMLHQRKRLFEEEKRRHSTLKREGKKEVCTTVLLTLSTVTNFSKSQTAPGFESPSHHQTWSTELFKALFSACIMAQEHDDIILNIPSLLWGRNFDELRQMEFKFQVTPKVSHIHAAKKGSLGLTSMSYCPKSTSWEQFGTNIASATWLASSARVHQGTHHTQSAAQASISTAHITVGHPWYCSSSRYGEFKILIRSSQKHKKRRKKRKKQKKKVSSVKLGRNKEEEKSDGTEEINIEEKKASDVKSGDTEELDLGVVQSTARQSIYSKDLILLMNRTDVEERDEKETLKDGEKLQFLKKRHQRSLMFRDRTTIDAS